ELNYHPNQNAVLLKQGRTYTIGVVLPDIAEAFYCALLSKIERYSRNKNYHVIFAQSLRKPEQERQILDNMKNLRVDGVLLAVSKPIVPSKQIEQLRRYNIPVVILDDENLAKDEFCQVIIEHLFSILEYQQLPGLKA
ncbi:MAG TPA: LacI family DNA-binding transcriptional regulator, partial [Pedobacter sp.]|nr:LacI family DNA-binding transcriptional regulator [Pedobacter sp.]